MYVPPAINKMKPGVGQQKETRILGAMPVTVCPAPYRNCASERYTSSTSEALLASARILQDSQITLTIKEQLR
jgi:hypothetical protein